MFRMSFRGLTGLLLAAVLASPSQAALIVGFEFADGGITQIVPSTGGSYTVNIVASTTNPATTNIGLVSGYLGALSQNLNGSTTGGGITASTLTTGLGTNVGALSDLNGDGHMDLGLLNGAEKVSPFLEQWFRPFAGSSAVLLGSAKGIIGTFTVTIPANTPNASSFLSYVPQLDPGGFGADWGWTEDGTTTSILSASGAAVQVGSSITFISAIPEPGTIALACCGVAGLAGFRFWRRKAI